MEVKKVAEIRLAVRQLVEFLLRSGDIDSRFCGFDRALEARASTAVCKSKGARGTLPKYSSAAAAAWMG